MSTKRLPDSSDLRPATLAGVRLVPAGAASTVGRVEVWADVPTGLPVRFDLYARDGDRPVVSIALRVLDLGPPDAATTRFVAGATVRAEFVESLDVAAAANAFADDDLPLRGQVAGPLLQRLRDSAAVEQSSLGTLLPVGPITLLITPRDREGSVLLAGTVTAATLRQAATELAGRR